MLVLSRTPGEKIHIGDDITIVITRVQGNRVGVGIEAPKDVNIRRDELDRPPTSPTSPGPPVRRRVA